jgi:hypothetical protein
VIRVTRAVDAVAAGRIGPSRNGKRVRDLLITLDKVAQFN